MISGNVEIYIEIEILKKKKSVNTNENSRDYANRDFNPLE